MSALAHRAHADIMCLWGVICATVDAHQDDEHDSQKSRSQYNKIQAKVYDGAPPRFDEEKMM